jgi:hypothetical protein
MDDMLLHTQKPAYEICLRQLNPAHNLAYYLISNLILSSINAWGSHVVPSLQIFQLKFRAHFSSCMYDACSANATILYCDRQIVSDAMYNYWSASYVTFFSLLCIYVPYPSSWWIPTSWNLMSSSGSACRALSICVLSLGRDTMFH